MTTTKPEHLEIWAAKGLRASIENWLTHSPYVQPGVTVGAVTASERGYRVELYRDEQRFAGDLENLHCVAVVGEWDAAGTDPTYRIPLLVSEQHGHDEVNRYFR